MVERAASSQAPRKSSASARAIPLDRPTLEKARWCRRRLSAWYHHYGRQFPWRSHNAEVYQQIVVEVLLQRTQASTVGRFFGSFFKQFGDWQDIDAAPTMLLENALRPIGLWRRRASALKSLALEMVSRGGQFPDCREKLETLPAIGQYVASAVLLFAHGKPEPLLDASMARVLERVFEPRRLVDIRYDARLQSLARAIVRSQKPAMLNWAVLDLAALRCTAQSPTCETCTLKSRCTYALNTQPQTK